MGTNLKLVTVATHETHELRRFIESAEYFGYDYEILGLGRQWVGGEANNGRLVFPGGGMKVNLLKDYLNTVESNDDVILFTDSYDVVFNGTPDELMVRWSNMGEGIIFTAEKTCWPDPKLEKVYPHSPYDYRFLNSGGFIGKVGEIKRLIETNCEDSDDDQLYYTLKFLNSEGIRLDYGLNLFQTLNESYGDVRVVDGVVHNKVTGTTPIVIHANGGVGPRTFLNKMYNSMRQPEQDMVVCSEKERVLIQIFLDFEHNNPSVMLDCIEYLSYPKGMVDIEIYNNNKSNDWAIKNFIKHNDDKYSSMVYYYKEGFSTYVLRDHAFKTGSRYHGDYVLQVDGGFAVKNKDTIQLLIEENKDIVSPMINEEQSLNSNFWGGVSGDGYYAESDNYFPIRNYEDKGTFVVPFVSGVIMYKQSMIAEEVFDGLFQKNRNDEYYGDDYYVVFCNVMRESNLFTYITNKRYFGKRLV